MIRSSLFLSLLLVCCLASSCSKSLYQPVQEKHGNGAIILVDSLVQKYELKFDFHRTHLSTIVAVRKVDSSEIRIIGASPFGLSLFDFGLREDSLHVYSCIEPLKKRRLLKILEDDFSTIFLSDSRVKTVKLKKEYAEYINRGGIARGVIRVSAKDGYIEKIKVRHAWIRLFMSLEKMKDVDATR